MWAVLSRQNQGVDDPVVQEVTEAVLIANPLYNSTKAKESVATDYRRNSYNEAKWSVVQPEEYLYE